MELAWLSGNVMDCHATARGSIPGRNGVFIKLHVHAQPHFTTSLINTGCEEILVIVYGFHLELLIHFVIKGQLVPFPFMFARDDKDRETYHFITLRVDTGYQGND